MKKLKIKGIGSEDYPGGRIDSFEIEMPIAVPPEQLILLFRDLKFSEEELEKLDTILSEISYLFVYGNPKVKAHIYIGDDNTFSLKLDTSLDRKEINRFMEKYFDFPD